MEKIRRIRTTSRVVVDQLLGTLFYRHAGNVGNGIMSATPGCLLLCRRPRDIAANVSRGASLAVKKKAEREGRMAGSRRRGSRTTNRPRTFRPKNQNGDIKETEQRFRAERVPWRSAQRAGAFYLVWVHQRIQAALHGATKRKLGGDRRRKTSRSSAKL